MIADYDSVAALWGTVPRAAARKRVEVVHAVLPGRARLMVSRLRGNPALQRELEAQLPKRTGIHAATASRFSGNVVVLFDARIAVTEIVGAVEGVLNGHPTPSGTACMPGDAISGGDATAAVAWHTTPVPAVLDRFGTSPSRGLSGVQVAALRARHGANILPAPTGRPALSLLLEQVSSLPVMLLLGSTVISLATGAPMDAALVLAVIAANAAIGFVTMRRGERLIRSLADFVPPPVRVVRDGAAGAVPAGEIVPGDLLLLSPGTIVAADARVVESIELAADESALTGESLAVGKTSAPVAATAPLAERTSMVHRGSTIAAGRGKAVVTATGLATELGHIQLLAATARPPPTPMERQLGQLGRALAIASLLACGGVFGVGLLRRYDALTMLTTSVALAVAAVPEGLPTVATVTLALGVRRMRDLNVLVRRLDAIETLGAVNVVCFDKTGTLTQNRMAVRRFVAGGRLFRLDEQAIVAVGEDGAQVGRADLHRLLHAAVLCNDAQPPEGSPTELALLEAARTAGIDPRVLRAACPAEARIDRSAHRRYMRTTHSTPLGRLTAVKGSPAEVLALCSRHLVHGREVPLLSDDRVRIEAENDAMAADGLRVLGFAAGTAADDGPDTPPDLVWLGLAGMADPVRPGMSELMRLLHQAGIETVLITGDQSMTAYAIAKELDLSGGQPIAILDGPYIDAMPAETLAGVAPRAHVFARVSPAHKLQIVQALQRAGKVVAMTGDGINDGPALRAADIGVAMGRDGTDAAREMADVVLADDNLATLAVAIREGRTIHRNIKKAVRFLLSTNLSEMFLASVSVALAAGQPLVPAQLLWLNLVSDVAPALALGMEQAEPDVLQQAPRDTHAPVFAGHEAGRLAMEGTLLGASMFAAHLYGVGRFGGPNGGGVGFLACTFAQLLHGWSSRSPSPLIATSLPPNRHLTLALGGLGAVQALAALIPATRRGLGLARPDVPTLGVIGLAAIVPFLLNELLKGAWPAARERTLTQGGGA